MKAKELRRLRMKRINFIKTHIPCTCYSNPDGHCEHCSAWEKLKDKDLLP